MAGAPHRTEKSGNRGQTKVFFGGHRNLLLGDVGRAAHQHARPGRQADPPGDPVDVVTEAVVKDVFGMTARVVVDPVSNTPMIVPIGRHHAGKAMA